MIKSVYICLVLVVVSFLFTGCFDYRDVEETALVAGIAIDKAASGYEVTAEILSMKSSSSEAVPNPVVVAKTSETVGGALEMIVATNVRQLYFGHCVVVLLSKDVAESGIRSFVDQFFHDNRINVSLDMIIIKNGKAADVFNCKPLRGNLVSFDIAKALRETEKENSTTKSIKVYECINAMENPGGEAFLPSLQVEDVDGEQRFSVSGLAVFLYDRLVGFLSEKESLYFLILTDDLRDGSLELEMSEGKYVHFNILSDKIRVRPKDDEPTVININVNLVLSMLQIPQGVDLGNTESVARYENTINLKIKESLLACIHKIRDGYKSDILAYGFLMYKTAPEQFQKLLDVNENYFDTLTFDIVVNAKLKSSGLSDKPIKGE